MKKLFILVALMLFVFGCATTGGLPAAPATPDVPAKPAMPDTPKAPAIPDAPKAPATPAAPAVPKVPGTPVSKASMSLESNVSNNPNSSEASADRSDAYPGVSIKNVVVQQRLGSILHEMSAGEIDQLVESHKAAAQGGATTVKQGVQRDQVPNQLQAETRSKIALKTDAVTNPKDNALPAYNSPASGSGTAQKDNFYPGVKNTVLTEKLNEISAKMERSITPRDDSGGSKASSASSKSGAAIRNPVQSDSKKRIETKTRGIGYWK